MWRLPALLMLSLAVGPSYAEFYRGSKLKELLDADERRTSIYDAGIALGYIVGVFDAYVGIHFCPPDGISVGQTVAVVRKYLNEVWNQAAYSLVTGAFQQAWPCKRSTGR
jgi:hypothetical protein